MLLRSAALAAALLVAPAAALSVQRCLWSQGHCQASAAYVLANAGGAKPASPMAESILRSLALDAACLVHKTEAACDDAQEAGCTWEQASPSARGVCTADPDVTEDKLARMPSMSGCPGSVMGAVAVCGAKARDACAAPQCAWLSSSDAAAALKASGATPSSHPATVQRGAAAPAAGAKKGGASIQVAAILDTAPADVLDATELVAAEAARLVGPTGEALVGCVPAKLRQLVIARDIKGLDKINRQAQDQDPAVYGACELPAFQLQSRCSDAEERADCATMGDCAWDGPNEECIARQGPLLATVMGAASRAPAVARSCHALRSASACGGSGTFEFDPKVAKALLPGTA